MPRTVPPVLSGPTPGSPRDPRNGLGAVTFAVVVLGAVLAVLPATAAFGFLLCLAALVPAFIAYRRTRKGTATDRHRSVAALAMAPAFLVVGLVVVGTTATPQVTTTSDASALAAAPAPAPPAAVAPLIAAPAPTSTTVDAAPAANPAPAVAPVTRKTTAPSSRRTVAKPAPKPAPVDAAAPAHTAAAAPAPVVQPLVAPPVSKPAPKPVAKSSAKPAPKPVDEGSSVACDEDTHYINAKHNCVLRPVAGPVAPSGATAQCKDGTYSSSQTHSGTCSRHGGVKQWL